MESPEQKWHIAQQNLQLSPYIATGGGLLAAVLCFWVPIYGSYLLLAASLGVVAFAIQWLGVRRHAHFGPIATILTIFAFLLGRERLLPHELERGTVFLCVIQFVGVWMFSFSALHLVFRKKLKKELEAYAP